MGHDVFISHSSKNKVFADAVCAALERNAIRCWVAPRDILLGASWAKSILKAIEGSRLMVLVFSGHAQTSEHIRREVERAVHNGIPVAPIRIEDVMPADDLEYFLSSSHWMDAMTPPFEQHLDHLTQTVRVLLEAEAPLATSVGVALPSVQHPPGTASNLPSGHIGNTPTPVSKPRRFRLRFLLVVVLFAGLIGAAVWIIPNGYTDRLLAKKVQSKFDYARLGETAVPSMPSLSPQHGKPADLETTKVAEMPPATVPAVTRADVVSAKVEAETAWETVRVLDRGQGFAALVDKADRLHRTADTYLHLGDYVGALSAYKEMLKQCHSLSERERQRASVAAARKAVEDAAQAARKVGADTAPAPSWWGQAERSKIAALKAFDEGDLAAAKNLGA